MAMSMTTGILNQYLKTATYGNVVAEYAITVDRWRLACTRCGQTLTFVENYDLDAEYAKTGRLDDGIQQFAKQHQHLKPKHTNQFGQIVFEPDLSPKVSVPKVGQAMAFVPTQTDEMLKKFNEYKNELEKKEALAIAQAKQQQLVEEMKKFQFKNPTDFIKSPNGRSVTTVPSAPKPTPRKTEGRKFR